MVTYFRVGSKRPTERLNLHVYSISPLPKSYATAFNDPNWQNAMYDEYNALIKNKTWTFVPRPTDANIVRFMLLFRHKYLANGTLSRDKARLVPNGSMQLEGVDVDETFSLLDVKNALLHGDLSKTVYMHQPPGFRDFAHLDYDCLLQRSLYRLKHDPQAWLQQFETYNTRRKYAAEIIERAHMVNCSLSRTPVDIDSKLGDDGDFVSDLTFYRRLAGALQCLTFTRPDISYAVQQYRGVANDVAETCLLRNLLHDLHTPFSSATLVYCDNATLVYCDKVSAVCLSSNPVLHKRTKNIEIDIHFVWDLVAVGQVRVLQVPSR
ncbi:ribonuclease H-like domain-containing protein [Tanacetum coccineum]